MKEEVEEEEGRPTPGTLLAARGRLARGEEGEGEKIENGSHIFLIGFKKIIINNDMISI